jgi:dihydrodipicolinate synthase/N-acetylneuraminate lyase
LYVWAEIAESAPGLAHFCGDLFFLTGLMHGARGMYSSLIYVLPGVARRIYDLAQAGDWAAAVPLDRALSAFVVEILEPLAAGGYVDGAIDKAMAEAAGYLAGGRTMRPPYRALSDAHADLLRRMLDKYRGVFAELGA